MSAATEGFAHPEYLVETDWLAAHLGDANLVVLDCTTHLIPDPKITYTVKPGREDFEKGHIPGAQFVGFARGGHLWVGHDAELAAAVTKFLVGTRTTGVR